MKFKNLLYALAIAWACAISAHGAGYGITFDINQVGSDVVITSSSANGLSLVGLNSVHLNQTQLTGELWAASGGVTVGSGSYDSYSSSALTSPSIGSGSYFTSTIQTGSPAGFTADLFSNSVIVVPAFYQTGDPLNPSSATYAGASFSTLGITAGTYTWTMGQNTITINATAASPVPEASGSVAGLGLAVAGLYQLGRRRRNTVTQ